MALSTPRFLTLGLLAALAFAQAVQAQQAPRYVFPNTSQGQVLALPNGQVLLASAANSRVLRLHWLNAQGDTVRGRRIVLPQAIGVAVSSLTANPYTGTILVGGRVLLSAQGDTIWTRPLYGPPAQFIGTPDGGFAALSEDTDPMLGQLVPIWLKISANGQKTGPVFMPTPAGVDYSYAISIVPAATGGSWIVVRDMHWNSTPYYSHRAIHVSETGVVGAQLPLSMGVNWFTRVEALPNPADGYLATCSGRIQRFSASWVPQWPAPVNGHDAMRVAPDGNALTFLQGPYARIPEAPIALSVGVGEITPSGQSLYKSVVDEQLGYDGAGLDIAKNTTGSLIVQTVQRYIGNNTPSLLVYTLPSAALATRAKAVAPALAVYPQPATEAVTVRTAGLRGQLTLLDGLGRVVRQLPVEAGKAEQQLPLQGLATGIYVLRATDKAGQQLSTRLSKQ